MPQPKIEPAQTREKTCRELFPNSPEAQVACEIAKTAVGMAAMAATAKAASRSVVRLKPAPQLKKMFEEQQVRQQMQELMEKTVIPFLPFVSPLHSPTFILPILERTPVCLPEPDVSRAQIETGAKFVQSALPFVSPLGATLNLAPTLFGQPTVVDQAANGLIEFFGL